MCGIVGIVNTKMSASQDVYECLLGLQHRGQDAAGIVTATSKKFYEKRGEGLVRDVFVQKDFTKLVGTVGMGHVRYRTTGRVALTGSQPFFVKYPFPLYLIHNGNLTNTKALKNDLPKSVIKKLRSDSDSEILLMTFREILREKISQEKSEKNFVAHVHASVAKTMQKIQGAYSVIMVVDGHGLLAFRDPHGIRPLIVGKRIYNGATDWAVASESSAFASSGFVVERDVRPGESLFITTDGILHSHQAVPGTLSPCIFEYIYLARPDSIIDGISVYKTQLRLGRALGRQVAKEKIAIDVVIPIPDSARAAASEVAHALHVAHREGLYRNRYVGRTFIMPEQRERTQAVSRKLSPIPLEIKGKRILLVDDSIVRGTTIQRIVAMCRAVGAKKVYVASAAPAVRFQNVYGVDIPTKKELIADNRTLKEIATYIGADKVFYQTVEDMISAAREGNKKIKQFEDSVFTGKYVTGDVSEKYLANLAHRRRERK
ncbi:MAG: amidophosphoribosyltransferase [Minisyncoccia bacterium]